MGTESQRPSMVERLRAQRSRHHRRPRAVRVLYVVAGFAILLAGVVLLITPGPAFVIIPVGLALLSLEFAWAEQLLESAVKKGEQAKARAARSTRTQRVLVAIAAVLVCAAVFTWGWLGDIPLLPL